MYNAIGPLAAIEFAIISSKDMLKGSHVKWFIDNQAAAKIVEVGSLCLELHTSSCVLLMSALKMLFIWIFSGSREI